MVGNAYLELGSGYEMSKYVETHKESELSIHLAQNVLVFKGLQTGLLNCQIDTYDPEGCLEFWRNMREIQSDPHAVVTKVRGKRIRVNQKLLTDVFGFETLGVEHNGVADHDVTQRLAFAKRILKDPNARPKMGLKNSHYPKEYSDLAGYFAKALWAFTSGNDELSARKIDMLMVIDEPENFDWGKYLVGLFKEFMGQVKLPLAFQIQKILDHENVIYNKRTTITQSRFKKPSSKQIEALSEPVINIMRQTLINLHSGIAALGQPKTAGASPNTSGMTLLVENEQIAQEDEMDDDAPISIYKAKMKTSKKSTSTSVPKFNPNIQSRDEAEKVVEIPHATDGDADNNVMNIVKEINVEHDEGSTDSAKPYGFEAYLQEKAAMNTVMLEPMMQILERRRASKRPNERIKQAAQKRTKFSERDRDVRPVTEMLETETETLQNPTPNLTESVKKDLKLTKRCRRRIKQLLAYKLSHRSIIPDQHMYNFEDWVSDQLTPLTFDAILSIPRCKNRVKQLIVHMKSAIIDAADNGKLDMRMEPDGTVSDLDDSDLEFEKEDVVVQGEQKPKMSAGWARTHMELDTVLSMLEDLQESVQKLQETNTSSVKLTEQIEASVYSHLI